MEKTVVSAVALELDTKVAAPANALAACPLATTEPIVPRPEARRDRPPLVTLRCATRPIR
ncbi:hypothetical protein D3C80_1241100 [compost metagenome]